VAGKALGSRATAYALYVGAGFLALRESPRPGVVRANEAPQAVDYLIEANMEPLPEHLSDLLVHAEELLPRQDGESEGAYLWRLSNMGYRIYGYRQGELLVGKPKRFQSRVKPS
jgi:hypothetical protein